ncbi:hypothetical protein B0H13DRAFT_1908937 [Mycena leptocephala]|nr:hypothetical protein B0H13DRAFT_1908937 [Mycena leptocephala]
MAPNHLTVIIIAVYNVQILADSTFNAGSTGDRMLSFLKFMSGDLKQVRTAMRQLTLHHLDTGSVAVLEGEEGLVSIPHAPHKMLLGFVLPLVFLTRPAYAQATTLSLTSLSLPSFRSAVLIPSPSHTFGMGKLVMITEQHYHGAHVGEFEDNGNEVVDIMAVEQTSISSNSVNYYVHASTPAGDYHIRMNGTIYNGNTPLSNITTRSPTMNITIIDNFQCNTPAAFTPVRSLSDADYSPVRVIQPVAGDVVDMVNPTLELVNMETGFNTSPQSLSTVGDSESNGPLESQRLLSIFGTVRYTTDNVTLKPGTWKMRMNFTVIDPGSTRKFSALSDEFFVAQQFPCVGLAQSSSSSSVATQSTLATGTSPPTLPTSSAAASKTPSSTSPSGLSNPSNARRVMRVSEKLLLGALLQATVIGFSYSLISR